MSTLISDRIAPKKSHGLGERQQSKQRRKSFATMRDALSVTKEYPSIAIAKKSIAFCSYSGMGCEFYANKESLEELMKHTDEQSEYHLRITTDAYKKLKAENEEIRKKYDKLKNDWNAYHMQVGVYSADKLHPNRASGKSSQPDLRRLSGERKISPSYPVRKSSSPKENTREKRLSGGRESEFTTSERKRKGLQNTPMSLDTGIEIRIDLLTTGEKEKDCGTSYDVLNVDEKEDKL